MKETLSKPLGMLFAILMVAFALAPFWVDSVFPAHHEEPAAAAQSEGEAPAKKSDEHWSLVMLLDRDADVFLAQRSGAEAWLVKPLDALRLRKAVSAAVAGDSYTEGVPLEEVVVEASDDAESEPDDTETAEAETVDAG